MDALHALPLHSGRHRRRVQLESNEREYFLGPSREPPAGFGLHHPAKNTGLLLLWDRFDRQACPLPGFESTSQRVNHLKPAFFQFTRHPGASLLSASGTVSHEHTVSRQLLEVLVQIFRRHMNRTWDLEGIPGERGCAACVHENYLLFALPHFINANATNRGLCLSGHAFEPP